MGDSPDWTTQLAFQATQIEVGTLSPASVLSDLVIAQYSSLIVFAFATPSGTAGPIILQFTQSFETGLLFAADSFYLTSELTNNNGFAVVEFPSLTNYLQVANKHPTQAAEVVVYGLNANALGLRRYLGYAQLPRRCNNSNPVAGAGSIVAMPIVDLPPGSQVPNQMAFNGTFSVSGSSNVAGTMFIFYYDATNAGVGIPVGIVTAGPTFEFTGYYEGYARLVFVPSSATTTLNVGAIVTAGPPAT